MDSAEPESSGKDMTRSIPYGRQSISEDDINAVISVLRSDFLTQGPLVPAFEERVAGYCYAAHGVAMNSATSALHVACLALGVGPGDIVWTSPNTFVASANCALYCGATVDFVDIDPVSRNLGIEALTAKLYEAKRRGSLPKVLVAVHFSGQPCDMRAIRALSAEFGFRVIEDASHALGGRYLGEPIGCGRYSDITVFSFHPVKMITTGEGGMALTHEASLANRMRRLRSHGITRDVDQMSGPTEGPWYYEQIELGFNYRMTDIQAALGLSQMSRLDRFIDARHRIAAAYDAALAGFPVITPAADVRAHSALHLYVIELKTDVLTVTRRQVFESLRGAGIGVNVHYIPVHLQPHYRRMGFAPGDFPHAETYYRRAISLPIYPDLGDDDFSYVLGALDQALHPE